MKKRLITLLLVVSLLACPAYALEGEAQRAAEDLSALGLVQGTPEGYALESGATRTQALVLLARLAGLKDGNALPYTDVPAWAVGSVSALYAAGYLEGIYAPPALYGGEFITADEWSALLLRLCGLSYPKEGASLAAVRLGLLPREYSSPLSRADLFQMTRDALTFSVSGGPSLARQMVNRGVCSFAAAEGLGLFDTTLTAREAADRHMAAIGLLETYASSWKQQQGESLRASTVFFLTPDGIAVTNHHCLEEAETAAVTLLTGETFPVEGVLWASEEADLAVIRVSRTLSDGLYTVPAFAHLTAVSSADAYPGDVVYALGNPLGLGHSVSSGVISAVERSSSLSVLPSIISSAEISSGSSGGALLNEYGHVIAVTSGSYLDANGLYISVPVDTLLRQDFTALTPRPLSQLNEAL